MHGLHVTLINVYKICHHSAVYKHSDKFTRAMFSPVLYVAFESRRMQFKDELS